MRARAVAVACVGFVLALFSLSVAARAGIPTIVLTNTSTPTSAPNTSSRTVPFSNDDNAQEGVAQRGNSRLVLPIVLKRSVTGKQWPPVITFPPGSFYFSVDGQTSFIFGRNVASFFYEDWGTWMDWALYNGDRVLRIYVHDMNVGGYGYANTGALREEWALKWDTFLTEAEAHGLYILPFFTGWWDWNVANGWLNNPFNPANGGPAINRIDIFQEGSPSQVLYLQWVSRAVARLGSHRNILAWEVLDEGNLIDGITEGQGIAFTEHMAQVVHAADPRHRPISASLAESGTWPNYYHSNAIDLIQVHPYPDDGQLDRNILSLVRMDLDSYAKPVLIGECGLNWRAPDVIPPTVTTAVNAPRGVRHAIWAGLVSGAANGRALWWEDTYGLFFKELRSVWLNQYADAELAAVRFTSGVDFTEFKPLTVQYPSGTKIWGAAVGNESRVLGWFRDAACEPPDWNLLPLIHGETVTIVVPGSAQHWQADFYDTQTGYALPGSTLLTRQGDHVTVALPDLTDDIAFKLFVNASGVIQPAAAPPPSPTPITPTNTDTIAGQWAGSIFGEGSDFAAALHVTIQPACNVGSACGRTATQWCFIDLVLREIVGDTWVLEEKDVSGTSTCPEGGFDRLRLQANGTILFRYESGTPGGTVSNGILHRD